MKGLYLDGKQYGVKGDLPEPMPESHEVAVRVLKAGVCETDLQLIQGYMGFRGILGHEFVGLAESGRYEGKRVAGNINCCPVDRCERCPENRHHCERRTVLGILQRDGAFAERLVIPEENLFLVPDEVEDDRAVFVEPLAAAFQILEQVNLGADDTVAVLGDGRLGFLIAQVIANTNADVTVVGKHADKLEKFSAKGLATVQLNELQPRKQFDAVIDCTGSASGLPTALGLVRPQGTVVLKTTIADRYQIDLSAVVIDEIRIVGSRCGPFERAIEALRRDEVDVRSLITSRFPLSQADKAIQCATQAGQHKVLIDIGD